MLGSDKTKLMRTQLSTATLTVPASTLKAWTCRSSLKHFRGWIGIKGPEDGGRQVIPSRIPELSRQIQFIHRYHPDLATIMPVLFFDNVSENLLRCLSRGITQVLVEFCLASCRLHPRMSSRALSERTVDFSLKVFDVHETNY